MWLEATKRWTEARLVALASTLALPAPVRESFLFDPDHAFRVSCTESDITLQRAIKRVFQHAGVPCDAAVVLWKQRLGVTTVERDGHSWFFEIDASIRGNANMLGAMIAREAGRALLAARGAPRTRTLVDEGDAELAATLAGLGALLFVEDEMVTLPQRLVRYAFVRVARSLGLGLRRTLDVLPRKAAIVLMWPRVRSRALPYGALEPHVVIRCFCARRLRVPTGAIGATTCPACKRKRPFDGRACRTQTLEAPQPLATAPLPVTTPLQRLGIAFARLPFSVQGTAILVILAISVVAISLPFHISF